MAVQWTETYPRVFKNDCCYILPVKTVIGSVYQMGDFCLRNGLCMEHGNMQISYSSQIMSMYIFSSPTLKENQYKRFPLAVKMHCWLLALQNPTFAAVK